MASRTQFPDFRVREFKRRHLDIDEPRTPTKVQGDDMDESRNPLIFHDVGLFSNPETDHRAYLEKYLTFASAVSDDRLMRRILYWLSGRWASPWHCETER
jgi:hypothetical protein